MALTVEDILARRIGLQLFGWRLAIQAAPTVASLLRQEFGWSPEQEQRALEQYVAKVNHLLESAGQPAEPATSAMSELTLERN
jgi:glycerol-3-phosphate dehydrogenase